MTHALTETHTGTEKFSLHQHAIDKLLYHKSTYMRTHTPHDPLLC